MGYILAIQQHTYQNYQYRMYKKDKSPHEIRGIKMVKFIPIQEDIDFYKQREEIVKKKKSGDLNQRGKSQMDKKETGNRNKTTYKITPSEERELIGKGYYVNMQI